MKIKKLVLGSNIEIRLIELFKQVGAKEKTVNGENIMVINTTPDIMDEKMEVVFEQLKRLGYDKQGQSMSHFFYFRDKQNKLPEISVESQGKEGFVKEKHKYYIYWA